MTQSQFSAHRTFLPSIPARATHHTSLLFLAFTFCLLAGTSLAWAGVTIGTPGASAQIISQAPFSATATSSSGLAITDMKVYLDGNPSEIGNYPGNGTSSFTQNATYAMGTGSHNLTVN